MIIKSMSRKTPTFSQLASYIGQKSVGGSSGCFSRNLYYDGGDQKLVSALFYTNYNYLPPRKNGNALYHEVLVLPPQAHLSKARQTQILIDLARKYCELRAPWQLAWGRVHFDTDCPHVHLMISANSVHSPIRERLSKQSFARIQKQMEMYKEAKFPELTDSRVYNQDKPNQRPQITQAEGEMVRRTSRLSQKQEVAQKLKSIFAVSSGLTALKANLAEHGFTLYQRGKNWGVESGERKKRYRLKTLGLASDFERVLKPVLGGKDERAKALLNQRKNLESHAQAQLDEFECEQSGEYER